MAKQAHFEIDSTGKAVNLMRLTGINFVDRTDIEATDKVPAGDWVFGFGATGYRDFFLNGDITPKKKEDIMEIVVKAINSKRHLPLPNGGVISVDIIDEIFINPKTNNLVITSIASRTVLFIAEKDKFKDLEGLKDTLSLALVELSNNKKAEFNWDDYIL